MKRRPLIVAPFRRLVVLAGCMAMTSCAARANLVELDAHVDVGGHLPSWTFHSGSACDFKTQETICVSGTDDGTHQIAQPYRPADVTPTIVDVLLERLPAFRNECGSSSHRIKVDYQGGYSGCTHCPPPGLGPRFGIGFVFVESPQGWLADADWSDTRGGTANDVALRFADALATFLGDTQELQCSQSPSREMLPPTSGTGTTRTKTSRRSAQFSPRFD